MEKCSNVTMYQCVNVLMKQGEGRNGIMDGSKERSEFNT